MSNDLKNNRVLRPKDLETFSPSVPIILFSFFILLFSFVFLSCNKKVPIITAIDPKIGRMGEVITLTGSNFGDEKGESYITIAGVSPTSSSYFSWQDDQIMVRVPELGESGLVYVFVKDKKSNGVLFSNIASVPRPIEGEGLGIEPGIITVNPQTGSVGTLVTITGINFGSTREHSHSASHDSSRNDTGVFFSWDYTSQSNPYAVREPEFVQVSENELGYESWSSREIIVRVPDGAVSGSMEVRSQNRRSRPVFFDVTGSPGTKTFSDKRSYTVTYSVDIRVLEATRPNSLYLWIPFPSSTATQRNVTLVSANASPFLQRARSINLYRLENLLENASHSINLSYQVEVYAAETAIRPAQVGKLNTPLSAFYTQSTSFIPANDPLIVSTVQSVTGNEQNPYIKARMIYDWITRNIEIRNTGLAITGNLNFAIYQKNTDAYTMALLYAAMLRAVDVPCASVAGVLIDRAGQTHRHYWTEFWIDAFGWVPVDPVLGSGFSPENFAVKEDYPNFYFGNIDNQRIAFSFGEHILSRIDRQGRLVSRNNAYSYQNIWEEAVGGLESYTSLWHDIVITGVYSQ